MSDKEINVVYARDTLVDSYKTIIDNLDSKEFVFEFRSRGLLCLEDERRIHCGLTRKDKMKNFFKVIYERIDLFDDFLAILKDVNVLIKGILESCYKKHLTENQTDSQKKDLLRKSLTFSGIPNFKLEVVAKSKLVEDIQKFLRQEPAKKEQCMLLIRGSVEASLALTEAVHVSCFIF